MAEAGKRVVHWHGDKGPDSVAHADELAAMPLHSSLRHYGGRSAFSVGALVANVADAGVNIMDPETAVFMCFTPVMILVVRNKLTALGVPLDRIFYEAYGPLAA